MRSTDRQTANTNADVY